MRKFFLAVAVLSAACSKRAPAPVTAPLQSAARVASSSDACAKVIPSQFSPSLPVPALDGGKLVYKMFFYGRDGNPQSGFTFHHAEGDATLSADGDVIACSLRAGAVGSLPKYVPKAGLTMDEFSRREQELYPRIADAGALYAKGGELTGDAKKGVAAMADAFAFFVEDGRGPDYRAASPAFWDWVEKNGGKGPATK